MADGISKWADTEICKFVFLCNFVCMNLYVRIHTHQFVHVNPFFNDFVCTFLYIQIHTH
jgi:hypothetical protein